MIPKTCKFLAFAIKCVKILIKKFLNTCRNCNTIFTGSNQNFFTYKNISSYN